ncbi:hypothetical protein R1flu_013710 [Riccia fluitans]|uniref:Uncharacterized protein n=1 Tax=Riccia fluitans TaxID=41844 RepID=A0ABD1YF54_9MARC
MVTVQSFPIKTHPKLLFNKGQSSTFLLIIAVLRILKLSDIKEMEEMDIDVVQRVQATYVSHLFGGGEEARHREVKICYTITTAHSLVGNEIFDGKMDRRTGRRG